MLSNCYSLSSNPSVQNDLKKKQMGKGFQNKIMGEEYIQSFILNLFINVMYSIKKIRL